MAEYIHAHYDPMRSDFWKDFEEMIPYKGSNVLAVQMTSSQGPEGPGFQR